MKKFALTGSFTGVVYACYDENGVLCSLETSQAQLRSRQVEYIFRNAAIFFDELPQFLATTKMKSVEVVEDVTFDMFYAAFGNKEGRKKAEAAWNKMSEAEQLKAYHYIPILKTKKQISGQALPYPASYLNQARWND
jgi:hypothetical protein